MKKNIVIAFTIVLAIAAAGLWLLQQGKAPLLKVADRRNSTELLSGKYAVKDVPANSFGELNSQNLTTPTNNKSASADSGSRLSASENMPQSSPSSAPVGLGGGGSGDFKMMPYPGGEQYRFVYKGEALAGLEATQSVYKRIIPGQSHSLAERVISVLSFGLLDLTNFHNSALQSFVLNEDVEYGYNVNVDVSQGSVNIYQNWEKWPQPFNNCRDEKCFEQSRLKKEDMLSAQESINIADNFLVTYGISKEAYGQPQIREDWVQIYEKMPVADRVNFYYPETVQVVYPKLIDSKEVFDESGFSYGLTLQVDIRTKKVSSMYELTTQQYEKSEYVGETDAQRIQKIAEQGGFRNYVYNSPNTKIINLELGTPSKEMVNMWYAKDGKSGEPLYVPALVFPITNYDKSNYWRRNVIVPLIKEMLDSDNNGAPIPVDMMKGGTGFSQPGVSATEPAILPKSSTPQR